MYIQTKSLRKLKASQKYTDKGQIKSFFCVCPRCESAYTNDLARPSS